MHTHHHDAHTHTHSSTQPKAHPVKLKQRLAQKVWICFIHITTMMFKYHPACMELSQLLLCRLIPAEPSVPFWQRFF